MDLNRIFDSFNDANETDDTALLIDFSDHPLFWISGFNKVLNNYLFFKEYTTKAFKNLKIDIDKEGLENAGEELMFRKAWDYIKSINLSNTFHVECLKLKANTEFIENLENTIKYFEALEEYEKCALLKNIEIKVKDLL